MTTHMPSQYDLMEKAIKGHTLDFIQVNLSLANQRNSSERVIPMAKDNGVAVLINRPFGGGGVFSKLNQAKLPEWATEFECESWAQFLLKYALSEPGVTATIPGMTKTRHVMDNMKGGMERCQAQILEKDRKDFLMIYNFG